MNDRQKEVLLRELKNEEKLRKELLTVYKEAEKQVSEQIAYLEAFGDIQSKIYQLKYQKYLKQQFDKIIDALKSKQYDKLNTYIDEAYRTRFIGTLYDIQGQGVPLLFPIDEGQVIDAVMINSKISKVLYDHLKEPFEKLKETIRREVARGIATGQSVPQIATFVSKKMTGSYKKPMGQYAYATRIARTEAHRVAEQAADDVRRKAIDAGAEIVKEWCSILDIHTRDDHAALNGQIRDIDEPFEIKGQQAQFPGDFGIARQDINCRCICLQRAKWAVEDRDSNFDLLNAKGYDDFKESFFKLLNKRHKNIYEDKDAINAYFANLARTNPKFDPKNLQNGYGENCQRCVAAFEMRCRGFNVEALPSKGETDFFSKNPFAMWKNIPEEYVFDLHDRKTIISDINRQMQNFGSKSRAIVGIITDKEKYQGHFFVAIEHKGKTLFVDPQRKIFDCENYFDTIAEKGKATVALYRIDMLKPSSKMKYCIKAVNK